LTHELKHATLERPRRASQNPRKSVAKFQPSSALSSDQSESAIKVVCVHSGHLAHPSLRCRPRQATLTREEVEEAQARAAIVASSPVDSGPKVGSVVHRLTAEACYKYGGACCHRGIHS